MRLISDVSVKRKHVLSTQTYRSVLQRHVRTYVNQGLHNTKITLEDCILNIQRPPKTKIPHFTVAVKNDSVFDYSLGIESCIVFAVSGNRIQFHGNGTTEDVHTDASVLCTKIV